jgi:DNA polymerase-1
MEYRGISVDKAALSRFDQLLGEGIKALTREIYDIAGGEFNINSTKQLGELLFDKLGLPPYGKTKTGYSTNVEVLEKLSGKHPIIEKIMEYRKLTKLKSTYADGLLNVISPDGRIHTSFNMTATATGRLSSTEPNLQNIPVRTELGGEFVKGLLQARVSP